MEKLTVGYSCGYHTGTDFPASGTSETNPDLYSVVEDGEVVYVYKDSTGTMPALRKSSTNFRQKIRKFL